MNENQQITFIKDLGMRFPTINSRKRCRYHLFRCFCGKEFETQPKKITSGHTKSCGCLRLKQRGLSAHRLYPIWRDMLRRCYNPKSSDYIRYGAIGVTVSKEWHDVKTFIEDMYPTFKEGLTLDKDKLCKEKGIYPPIYSKDTCCWATKTEQVRITRRLSIDNTSGYRGVILDKRNNRYYARVMVNNKNISLGYHSTPLEAAKARDKYIIDNSLEHTLNDVL